MTLSRGQVTFLALHVKRVVDKWQWHFSGCTMRASAGKRSAALGREELEWLVQEGFMQMGLGVSVCATLKGRALVVELERPEPLVEKVK